MSVIELASFLAIIIIIITFIVGFLMGTFFPNWFVRQYLRIKYEDKILKGTTFRQNIRNLFRSN